MTLLERADVQGLLVRGHGRLPAARFELAAVEDPVAAKAWLARSADAVDDGGDPPGEHAFNVALSPGGMERLGLGAELRAGFADAFLEGMTAQHRRRALGDTPEHWDWGAPGGDPVDVALLLYALDEATLDARLAALAPAGLRIHTTLETAALTPTEPFGFRDGISQPALAGLGDGPDPPGAVRAGEFVLGYENEYGHVTSGPRLPDGRDLARNGSYLVVRQLEQDVDGFWSWCAERTPDAAARDRLAAKIVGRWPSGAPLALAPDADRPSLAEANDFGYHAEDPHGYGCPVGAHVRRVNPRDSLDPGPGTERSLAVNRRHRLLRRGRAYDGGLHFLCLGANLARQFEFVQHTWMNNPRFGGLYDAPDPLSGEGGTFSIPARPVRERFTGLPRFVTVRGGAYLFLPGISALRALAALP